MQEPKSSHLKVDETGTVKFRTALGGQKAVRITINIDAKSLQTLKKASKQTGMPYQALLRELLKDGVKLQDTTESRLSRLEREIRKMKRMHVA